MRAANTKLIDELLKDYKKPEDFIGETGLLKQLTTASPAYTINTAAELDGQIAVSTDIDYNQCRCHRIEAQR